MLEIVVLLKQIVVLLLEIVLVVLDSDSLCDCLVILINNEANGLDFEVLACERSLRLNQVENALLVHCG